MFIISEKYQIEDAGAITNLFCLSLRKMFYIRKLTCYCFIGLYWTRKFVKMILHLTQLTFLFYCLSLNANNSELSFNKEKEEKCDHSLEVESSLLLNVIFVIYVPNRLLFTSGQCKSSKNV